MNISHAYTELQKENCVTQDEVQSNSTHYEELCKQMDDKKKDLTALRKKVLDIESYNQRSKNKLKAIIKREQDLKKKKLELESKLRATMEPIEMYDEYYPKTSVIIGHNKNLEARHEAKAGIIESRERHVHIQEIKCFQNIRSQKDQEEALERKESELNLRSTQLMEENKRLDASELDLQRRMAIVEKQTKELHQQQMDFLNTETFGHITG